MRRKIYITASCVLMAVFAMGQKSPSYSLTSSGWNRYSVTQAASQNQWDNLTQQQKSQIDALNQRHMEEREACKANPNEPNCKDLHKRQKAERQNLAQSLGVKHLPQAEHSEHQQHHGSPGPGYGRPQRGNAMPSTTPPSQGKSGRTSK
jgi:hypothetical protein